MSLDVSKLTNQQFAVLFSKIINRIQQDPIEDFIKAQGFLDFIPSPAQEVVFKIIFGKELDSVVPKQVKVESRDEKGLFSLKSQTMTEYEIYEFLTEHQYDPSSVKEIRINKIDLICGRRSGKTLLAASIAIYCAVSNNWKPFLKKHPFATVLIMSHSREFSDEVLEVIRSLIESSPVLSRLVNQDKKNTTSTMNLKVPWIVDGAIQWSRVQIKVAAASSKTTRGVAACAIISDEISFWNLSEDMKETDAKIMAAVRPSMKQFGEFAMLIKLSSPGIKQGVLYGEYKKSKEGELPKSYAVFKAPTWMMNEIIKENEFAEEHKLDPDGFDTEYRGNFADSLSNFIVPEYIDMAIMKGSTFNAPETESIKYAAAIDAAYKGDSFTFTVTGFINSRLRQYVSKGWKGTKKNPVSSYEVAEYIRTICKEFNIDFVAADQYSFEPLREIFDKYGVTLEEYTFTSDFKKKIYFNLKKLIHSQQADLLDSEVQTKELKELIVEQGNMGSIRIGHPSGGSDDYATSLAISSYLATQDAATGNFEFVGGSSTKSYGLAVDKNGISFKAPSAQLLVRSGHLPESVEDNSDQFEIDPETGKLIRKSDKKDSDDSDDGTHIIF